MTTEPNIQDPVAPAPADAEHFFVCEGCGQTVDRRAPTHVFHHLQADHRPLTDAGLWAIA